MSDRGIVPPGGIGAPTAPAVRVGAPAVGGAAGGAARSRVGAAPGATGHGQRGGGAGGAGSAEESAHVVLRGVLEGWGLGELVDWAWAKIVAGASIEQVVYELRQTTQYKTRFSGNAGLVEKGYTPLSEAAYLDYENSTRQMYQYYGLPKGFHDSQADLGKLIAGNVSVAEQRDKVVAYRALLDAEPAEQQAFGRLYGIDSGTQLAYFIDPDRALPFLQRAQRSASVASAALTTGFGEIDRITAERLDALGVDSATAAAGFTDLARAAQVTGQILGDQQPGMSQQEQLAATFEGNAAAQAKLSRRAKERTGAYTGGAGQYATTNAG